MKYTSVIQSIPSITYLLLSIDIRLIFLLILILILLIYQRRFIRREVLVFGFVMNDNRGAWSGLSSALIISFLLSRIQAYNTFGAFKKLCDWIKNGEYF